MPSTNGFHLLDYIEFLIKRKQLILIVFFVSLVTCYAAIYTLVEEQFEASATIIPREDETSSIANSVLRGVKGVPLNFGGASPSVQIDLYKTIVYSRTMMESVITKFNLVSIYKIDTADPAYMERAVKRLSEEVQTKETEEGAFLVGVRAGTGQRASDMTNYIVEKLNDRIIELHVSSSRDNRIFLENRVQELSSEIRVAEDTLRAYQERTGLLDIKTQLQGILTTHATLETEFAGKQLQLSILRRMYNNDSPQVRELEIQVQEYEKKLQQLRTKGDPGSPLLPLKELPMASVGFLNRYREVEIDNLLLEYVMPLYEQAKIQEKKDYPVLQIIDHAVPPMRKSYPPRVLFSLLGACFVTISLLIALLLRDKIANVQDQRIRAIFGGLRHWDWKRKQSG